MVFKEEDEFCPFCKEICLVDSMESLQEDVVKWCVNGHLFLLKSEERTELLKDWSK